MWSLQDIKRMNDEAAARKKAPPADPCAGHECEYCEKQSTHHEEYWDIFSDDPKGNVYTCDEHYETNGGAHEGYFWCEECNRVMVENYTWEEYCVCEDGGCTCLKCAFEKHVADRGNWMTKPKPMTLESLKNIPHLIAVDSTYWEKSLVFIGNAEFDSMDGHQISGDDLSEMVAKAIKDHRRCIVLMDAAYQFAVSFGVYVRRARDSGRKR